MQATVARMHDEAGQAQWIAILRDVTERRVAEEALLHLAEEQAALRRVATSVASSSMPPPTRCSVSTRSASSRRAYQNPYEAIVWPETLDREQWFTSPELVSLYGTPWIIVFAYLARFLPVVLKPVLAGMIQVDKTILTDVVIEPSMLDLGQQLPGESSTHTLTLHNTTGATEVYTMSYESAVATSGTANDWGYYLDGATATFSAPTVTVPAGASDEVRRVVNALDRVQATAYDLATEQATLRRSTSESLANLGRRMTRLGRIASVGGTELTRQFMRSGDALLDEHFDDERLKTALAWMGAQSGPPTHEVATADLVGWNTVMHLKAPGHPYRKALEERWKKRCLSGRKLAHQRLYIAESRDDQASGRFDWLGAVLVALAVGGLSFGAIYGQQRQWQDALAFVALVQLGELSPDDVTAALETYMPAGKMDEYMMFASSGHAGQVFAIGQVTVNTTAHTVARARWVLMGMFALQGVMFSSWLARLPSASRHRCHCRSDAWLARHTSAGVARGLP